MKHKLTIAASLAVTLMATSAMSQTATSKALLACSPLHGKAYHTCLNKIPSCEVFLTKDVDNYWHKGMKFSIDGGSEDPSMLCQHGGGCIPLSAVRFKTTCSIVDLENENGSYYHWERGQ